MFESLVQYRKSKAMEVGIAFIGGGRKFVHPMNLWTSQYGHAPQPSFLLHGKVIHTFQGGYVSRFHGCKVAVASNMINFQLS